MASSLVLQRNVSTPRAAPRGTPRANSGVGTPKAGRTLSRHAFEGNQSSSSNNATGSGAGEAPEPARSVLEDFAEDKIFSRFLADDFNATKFASMSLSSGTAAASSLKLNAGIQLLERQLRSEVVMRHDELLQQVASLADTESVLAVVRAGVESLQASVQHVRSEIADPYKQIKLRTQQLTALHATVELLRSVIRVLKLVRKLREQMVPAAGSGRIDLAKAAQLFNEIDKERKEVDLTGVDVVEAELAWLSEVGGQIRTEAMKSLEAGMEALNQAEVASVLQVYYNMGELKATVEVLFAKYRMQATRAVSTALDMKAISSSVSIGGPGGIQRAGTPALGKAPRDRDALWQRMQQCMDGTYTVIIAVWHLQRVLTKKRDPNTHACFINEVTAPDEQSLCERLWESVVKAFNTQLRSAFNGPHFLRETFVQGYPRLLGLVEALLDRLARDTAVKGIPPAVKPEERDQLAATLEPFQTAYLTQSLSRVTELVTGMFSSSGPRGATPSQEQIAKLAARYQEEIEAVRPDPRLTHLVAKGLGKGLQLLAEKAEYQLSTGPEAKQVAAAATPAQIRNATLCLLLQDLHSRISTMRATLPEAAAGALVSPLAAVHAVANEAIRPLFKAMVERIEGSILQVHDTDFGSEALPMDMNSSSSSKFMEEAQKAIFLFRQEFLSKLMPTSSSSSATAAAASSVTTGASGMPANILTESISASLTRKMASRVLVFFVRHAALVRPLSESGKLRLARDMAELESVVTQNLFPVEQLGAPYRALRAFRPLIFLDTQDLPTTPLLQELLPSIVLHHMYTRAPQELQLPHKRNGMSPAAYSVWLDTHSEEEVWKEIKATLDAYAAVVRRRGDKEFAPIYPLMMSLGQNLVENSESY